MGTPQRLADLVENGESHLGSDRRARTLPRDPRFHAPRMVVTAVTGALATEAVRRIVIDASHIDQKKRGILDTKDSVPALVRFLTLVRFKVGYEEGIIQVIVF